MNNRLAVSLIAASCSIGRGLCSINDRYGRGQWCGGWRLGRRPGRRNRRRHRGCGCRCCRGDSECGDHLDSQGEPSVVVRERVVVGEPLPPAVELRTVPSHTEYRYAIVNDQRVIVEPRTRKVIRIID